MANKVESEPGGKNLAVVPNRKGPFIITGEGKQYTTFTVVQLSDAEAEIAHRRFLKKYGESNVNKEEEQGVDNAGSDEIE